MLRLSEFSYNHLPSGVIMLAKFIRRGSPVKDVYGLFIDTVGNYEN